MANITYRSFRLGFQIRTMVAVAEDLSSDNKKGKNLCLKNIEEWD
jgi:hypothetical protein